MVQTLSQMYFLLTSISVVFTGMNCILFLFCVYVLWGQQSTSRGLLLLSCIVQISLSLAQTILFVTYLSMVYTVHADEAERYFLHLSNFALPSYIIYILNIAIEGFLLIWRIYVLYNNNIVICIPTSVLLASQLAFSGATAKGAATQHVNLHHVRVFAMISSSLIVAVNVSATFLIGLRLWTARQKAKALLSVSKYKSTILIVVECGALVTICTLAMLILRAIEHPVGIASLGITTQAATMAPLLIVARYGVLHRRDDRCRRAPQISVRINVMRTEDTRVDLDSPTVEFSRHTRYVVAGPLPDVSGGDYPKPPFSDA